MQWLGNQSKRWFTFLASPCFKSGFAQNNGWLPFQHCQCAWQNREVASTMPNSISMVLGWKDALSQCNFTHSCPPSLLSLPSLWLSKCTHPAILIHLCGDGLREELMKFSSFKRCFFPTAGLLWVFVWLVLVCLFSLVLLLFGLLLLHLVISLTLELF